MSLADSLDRSADELPEYADDIRPANGDPWQLLDLLADDAARQVVEWLLAHALEDAEELASIWLEDERGAEIVLSLETGDLAKPARKVLRRLGHRARSQGINISQPVESAPKVARLPEVDQKIGTAYVSGLDPRGSRLVYLVESHPAGGARVFECLLDLDRGVIDFQAFEAGRRQVRDLIRDLTHRAKFPAVEAELESVRRLIARHVEIHPSDRPLPTAFVQSRSKLHLDGCVAPVPGALVLEELGHEVGDDAIGTLVAQVESGDLGPWPPPAAVLQQITAEILTVFGAEGAESEGIDDDSVLPAILTALEAVFLGEAAGRTAERLEESAYVFWRSEDEPLARACLASAAKLKEDPPQTGPVLEALIEKISGALLADLKPS